MVYRLVYPLGCPQDAQGDSLTGGMILRLPMARLRAQRVPECGFRHVPATHSDLIPATDSDRVPATHSDPVPATYSDRDPATLLVEVPVSDQG